MTTILRFLLIGALWVASFIVVVALLGLGVVALPETALRALVSIIALVAVVATLVLACFECGTAPAGRRLRHVERATTEVRRL